MGDKPGHCGEYGRLGREPVVCGLRAGHDDDHAWEKLVPLFHIAEMLDAEETWGEGDYAQGVTDTLNDLRLVFGISDG